MYLIEILLISVSLGMDAFAVSISIAISQLNLDNRQKFRIYFHFGLFQFLFPLIGYYAVTLIGFNNMKLGKHIAFLILIFLGIKMLYDGFKNQDDEVNRDLTRGLNLVLFSSGVSIDALSVGVSFAMLNKAIFILAFFAGIITSLMSYIGLKYGLKLGERFENYSEILGGLILILIAVKIGFF